MFTPIRRSTLERSLEYLVCPADQGELELDVANRDWISEGKFQCTECDATYNIRNGVPYFFDDGNGYEWDKDISEEKILASIIDSIGKDSITWTQIIALSNLFLDRFRDRKQAIDAIFKVVERVVATIDANSQLQAYLTQAATAARYNLENYRGTFTLPNDILKFVIGNYQPSSGIVVEGACATGECLLQLTEAIGSDFYLGLDIAGAMVRNAQQQALENMLFVQADICSLPIRTNSAGIYVLNNVFDRVMDPQKACEQANRILNKEQSELVLSNCDPLQYGYVTEEGLEVTFVPEEKQISLEKGFELAGFRVVVEQKGIWPIYTVAYDQEFLPYKSLGGRR